MQQDRYGNWYETEDDPRPASSQLRRRSTYQAPLQQVQVYDDSQDTYDDQYETEEYDDYDDYLEFEAQTMPNKLYTELARRGGRQPHTTDDPYIRANILPRLTLPEPGQKPRRRISRRAALYALGSVGIGVLVGGIYVKSQIDEVQRRERDGQYAFNMTSVSRSGVVTEIDTWITQDMRVAVVQRSGSDERRVIISPMPALRGLPADCSISFDVQMIAAKYVVMLSVLNNNNHIMIALTDNGKFFI